MNGIAPGVALCAALVVPAAGLLVDEGSRIDWQRSVIKAMGKGAPDLNAPSIAVARAAAERAALAAAQRRALRILEGAALDDGTRVETLLREDSALRTRVESKLRGVRAAKVHYFTDGGVWLEIEVPFAALPPRIADHLREPSGRAADTRVKTTDGGVEGPRDAGIERGSRGGAAGVDGAGGGTPGIDAGGGGSAGIDAGTRASAGTDAESGSTPGIDGAGGASPGIDAGGAASTAIDAPGGGAAGLDGGRERPDGGEAPR